MLINAGVAYEYNIGDSALDKHATLNEIKLNVLSSGAEVEQCEAKLVLIYSVLHIYIYISIAFEYFVKDYDGSTQTWLVVSAQT